MQCKCKSLQSECYNYHKLLLHDDVYSLILKKTGAILFNNFLYAVLNLHMVTLNITHQYSYIQYYNSAWFDFPRFGHLVRHLLFKYTTSNHHVKTEKLVGFILLRMHHIFNYVCYCVKLYCIETFVSPHNNSFEMNADLAH